MGVSMQPAKRVGFSAESKRAGWISAVANVALFSLLGWIFRNTHSASIGLFYPGFGIALGVVAVGVLNWRRWHSFGESMAASFQAALAAFKMMLLTLLLVALVVFAWRGPAAFLLVLIYVGAALVIYGILIFAIAVLLACAGGAILYGLFVVLRYAGRIGQAGGGGDEFKPRPLASVSL